MLNRISGRENRSASASIPILLCNASYYGTLAAIRSLGRRGVPVVTVDSLVLAPGYYSRFSGSHLRCPCFEETSRWVEWLVRLGRSAPRRAIYATSDAVSFALASRRDELREFYDMYQPDLATMMLILDKGQLIEQARAVGIDTPDTWLPSSRRDAERIAGEVGGTLLVKPRSQLCVRSQTKGVVAGPGSTAVMAEYDRMIADGGHNSDFARLYPEVMLPMMQRYIPEGRESIYSLSGFRDISGKNIAMLGAYKVLQQPRRLGIGLCFEEAAVDPDLAGRVIRLCERMNYYGAFELEFIIAGGRQLLIDFNARFYNQMMFDIARGLDLPGLVYAATIGDEAQVARLMPDTSAKGGRSPFVFCNHFGLSVAIAAQRVLGTMSRHEQLHWREWRNAQYKTVIDAVGDPDDPLPAAMDAAGQLLRCIRHPRAFVRQMGPAGS